MQSRYDSALEPVAAWRRLTGVVTAPRLVWQDDIGAVNDIIYAWAVLGLANMAFCSPCCRRIKMKEDGTVTKDLSTSFVPTGAEE